MPYIPVTDDCYKWFQHIRQIEIETIVKGKIEKRQITISKNEAVILMLNMWEAGNMGSQVKDCFKDPITQFPKRIFEHYNGKFYRTDTSSR